MHCGQILKIFQILLNSQRLPVIKEGKKFPLILTPDVYPYSTATSYQPVSSVQSLSCIWLFETPWTAARQASLPKLLKLMSVESVMPSNHPSSVVPFSSCLQSFPASGSFPMSQFFVSDGQNIGVSTSASVLLMNIQDWFPLGWIGWLSCNPRDFQESSPTPQFKSINFSVLSLLYGTNLTSTHN